MPEHGSCEHGGLAQDAPHQLRQGRLCARIGQDRQHIGKRTVPSFLQSVFGDDEANLAIARQQAVIVVRFLQIVLVAGLDRNFFGTNAEYADQMLFNLFGMSVAVIVALISAGAFHLHKQNRPDIAPGIAS